MTEMRDCYFCRILAPPNAPPPLTPKYLTILMTERGGAIVFSRILAPPNDPPPPQTPQYLTILQTERGRALPLVGFWPPPPAPPRYATDPMSLCTNGIAPHNVGRLFLLKQLLYILIIYHVILNLKLICSIPF